MDTRQQIKHLLISSNLTMTELCGILSQKWGKDYSMQNLSSKLRRNTIKYCEMKDIFDVLGYEIIVRKK